ncbi:MAG TPA: deoxyribonuclease IV [Terriglobales bacterium]|jgi:deoxyribonuclease-4|nr:deoxyribonuclease IV [Terriglobales bacterium]
MHRKPARTAASQHTSTASYTFSMPRSIASEHDILKLSVPKRPPRLTSRRIGIHTSTAGGVQNAAERAYRLGCNTFQIFSSSPRQWAPYELSRPQCDEMMRLREKYDLKPVAIHVNYLVNLASTTPLFLKKSTEAFRGEVERALALCADYLVLHPGSFRGADREAGLIQTSAAIAAATQGLDIAQGNLTILIENTAGAEYSLGGSFEQVAEVLERLRNLVPIAACIDTCHTHVAGYDIVSESGMRQTLAHLDETVGLKNVRVWHCNDAKAACGSKLDRHQHIGKGSIGCEPFRRLLNDPRLAHAAFIAETPIDQPGDDKRNIAVLKELVTR